MLIERKTECFFSRRRKIVVVTVTHYCINKCMPMSNGSKIHTTVTTHQNKGKETGKNEDRNRYCTGHLCFRLILTLSSFRFLVAQRLSSMCVWRDDDHGDDDNVGVLCVCVSVLRACVCGFCCVSGWPEQWGSLTTFPSVSQSTHSYINGVNRPRLVHDKTTHKYNRRLFLQQQQQQMVTRISLHSYFFRARDSIVAFLCTCTIISHLLSLCVCRLIIFFEFS